MKKDMMMKWAVCLALLTGATQAANAQEEDPKYHLGVRVGYSETNVWHDLHLDGRSEWNCRSFQAGLAFDTRLLSRPLYFETGLYGSNRGVYVIDGSREYRKDNFSLMAPALLSYHFHPGHGNFGIAPFGGVFFAYNCGFEKPDYGFKLGFGVNYKKVVANFGFDFGLRDNMFYNKEGWAEHDGMLTSFFVNVGWNFLGNK